MSFSVQINQQLHIPTQQLQSVPFQSLLFHRTVTLVKSNSRSMGWITLQVLKLVGPFSKNMERKSFAIGALSAAVVALSVNAIAPSTSGKMGGRFEMHTLTDSGRILVFDHQTGQVQYTEVDGQINTNKMEVELSSDGLGSGWRPLVVEIKD